MREMKETEVEKRFKSAEGEFAPYAPEKECIEAQTATNLWGQAGKCGVMVAALIFGAMRCDDPCSGTHSDNGPTKSTCRCEYHKDPENIEKENRRLNQKFGR